MKKKRVNEGLRSISRNFIDEKELEENIKTEISSGIYNNKKRS